LRNTFFQKLDSSSGAALLSLLAAATMAVLLALFGREVSARTWFEGRRGGGARDARRETREDG
jgi:hypothetical protein